MGAVTFKTAFPADDPVAPFTIAMAMVANDAEYAVRSAVRANENEYPTFTFWVRICSGFTFEGIRALHAWRQDADVRAFLSGLSPEGKKNLKVVLGIEQQIGIGALEEIRNQTFHYPRPESGYSPDSAAQAREILKAEEDGLVEMDMLPDRSVRFTFADGIGLGLALRKHYPPSDPRFLPQAKKALDGSIAFAQLAREIVLCYLRQRGISVQQEM